MVAKVEITFLGTADAIPTRERNHTSILLNFEGENLLIDCGEGTQRQFRIARLNPCKITRLLITHWHADHVLGIPGLLKTLELSGYNKTLYIYGPKRTGRFIKDLFGLFAIRPSYKVVVEEVHGKFFESEDFLLMAEKMDHTLPCNAYSFVRRGKRRIDKGKLKRYRIKEGPWLQKLQEGKSIRCNGKKYSAKDLTYLEPDTKICFILDTVFNKKAISFAKDSDVLICEANFGAELEDKAKERKHLTSKQAAEIAKKARVKKLVLTHFSQRYDKNPEQILEEAKKVFDGEVVLAKDFYKIEI